MHIICGVFANTEKEEFFVFTDICAVSLDWVGLVSFGVDYKIRKRLNDGTVPANKKYAAGTVSSNKEYAADYSTCK